MIQFNPINKKYYTSCSILGFLSFASVLSDVTDLILL